MKSVTRTLLVKAVGYELPKAVSQGSKWVPPRIEDEIKNIWNKAPKLKGRHYPLIKGADPLNDGTQCLFINTFKDLGAGQGVIFEVCSYIKGHVPEAAQPDLESAHAEIKPAPIIDEEGNSKELVYTYRCLAFGQVMIIESVMGSGGVGSLQRMLRRLIKEYSPKGHGFLKFGDVVSDDLRALIKSRGGIKAMRASVLSPVFDGSKYAAPLGALHKAVKGTNRCVVEWSTASHDELDIDTAFEMMDEVGDLGLAGVSISFNAGGGVSDSSEFMDLNKYKECKPVKIQLTRDGRPAVTEIESSLVDYINALRDPANPGPIKSDGTLRDVKPLSVGKK